MKFKKKLFMLLALIFAITSCCTILPGCSSTGYSEKKIAMVTDAGDITDQSFNQATYEACEEYVKGKGITFKYYKPSENSDAARVTSIKQAEEWGASIIVLPGYIFAKAVKETIDLDTRVKFICLDLSQGDLGKDFDVSKHANLTCVTYSEEESGFLAGFATIMAEDINIKNHNFGFLGGMSVPAVMKYGYGFIQGIDLAIKYAISEKIFELPEDFKLKINFGYACSFTASTELKQKMDTWVSQNYTTIFACGGGIFQSVCEALVGKKGYFIGVDTDQRAVVEKKYNGAVYTLTSATKGLGASIVKALDAIYIDNTWESIWSGKINGLTNGVGLGIVSGDDMSKNFVGLPMSSFYKDGKEKNGDGTGSLPDIKFADYKEFVKYIYNKKVEGLLIDSDTKNLNKEYIEQNYKHIEIEIIEKV